MKKTINLFCVLVSLILIGCDPIYSGELRNNTDSEIVVKFCGQNLQHINSDNSGTEIPYKDILKNCKVIKLPKDKAVQIAIASRIATPITYEDLGFNELVITTKDGQIQVTGKEIMNLFEIKKIKNIFWIHTSDAYLINVGKD